MKSETKLKCPCGHQGRITMRENDAPFTASWEEYTLHGFSGKRSFDVSRRFVTQGEVFAELAPVCPDCGLQITEKHIVK